MSKLLIATLFIGITLTGCLSALSPSKTSKMGAQGDISTVSDIDTTLTSEVLTELDTDVKGQLALKNTNLEEGATSINLSSSTIPWVCATLILCVLAFSCRNISLRVELEADKKRGLKPVDPESK